MSDNADINIETIESAWLVERAGIALYGERWHTALGRDLGMSARHMHRLATGAVPLSRGVKRDIALIIERRQGELGVLASLLRE